MAESMQHIKLVRYMYSWVRDNYFDGDDGAIYVDLPETPKCSKPLNLPSGVRPDLSAKRTIDDLLIIGEAKTALDLEARHSIMQYKCYIEECEFHPGPALIVIIVPWFYQKSAENLFFLLLKKMNASKTEIKVLEK